MHIFPRLVLLLSLLLTTQLLLAADVYDVNADARQDISHALASSAADGKLVMLQFGANWCRDCLVLAAQFAQQPLKGLLEENFHVVKVDIGDEYEKNQDIQSRYNNATEYGIPTIIVLDKDDNILLGTLTGELANARRMGKHDVYKFFQDVVTNARKTAGSN